MIHYLKTHSEVFNLMKSGKKTFDYRKNDRGFNVGDWVNLVDYNPDTKATGTSIDFEITYILYGGQFGIPDGYCILQLKRLEGMYHG